MIEELFAIQNRLAGSLPIDFKRSLYNVINWDQRMIILTGARGTGKTTMVLQHYIEKYHSVKRCLYLSADNPLVLKTGIYQTASEYFKYYGDCLIVDEVHKQKDWSVELKALYDAYPDKQFIVLGSSTLNIKNEKGDLSRRGLSYTLPPLSFREYLQLKYQTVYPVYSFSQILADHERLAGRLVQDHKAILTEFNQFLMNGSYPFFLNNTVDEYFNMLSNIIDKVIYEDISTIKTLKSFSSLKLKKLLAFIALSKIPLFNIESLKTEIEVSKDTLYEYFDLLDRADLVNIVRTKTGNIRAFKNSKILFKTPNLYYAIALEFWKKEADKGNIRESFFSSQAGNCYTIFSSLKTDFVIRKGETEVEIEIGGRSKKKKQIKSLENAFLFKDGIEIGMGNTLPLYLAGFLY
ncbi:MAG: AAA family ATPase [Deltaproteobacteria bacterium]|nr:AAA family ATPase [Deltaproteobacteria bacterium]